MRGAEFEAPLPESAEMLAELRMFVDARESRGSAEASGSFDCCLLP
jgi:hypothetical protein